MSTYLLLSIGLWLLSSLGPLASPPKRVTALLQVVAFGAFGAVVWLVAQKANIELPWHATLWLTVVGSLPWLVHRQAAKGLWFVAMLSALAATVLGFGHNDMWLGIGGALLLVLAAVGGLRASVAVATLWGWAATLITLFIIEILLGTPLNLPTLTAASAIVAGVYHYGIQLASQRNWMLPPILLQAWGTIFVLIGVFVPFTLLLDPSILPVAMLLAPIVVLGTALVLTKGWEKQRPYLQAIILWGGFILTGLLPENAQTLVLRAVGVAIGGLLALAVGLPRSTPRKRNGLLVAMALIVCVLIFGLQFRNLNIM